MKLNVIHVWQGSDYSGRKTVDRTAILLTEDQEKALSEALGPLLLNKLATPKRGVTIEIRAAIPMAEVS
jgi:hypothetical protein